MRLKSLGSIILLALAVLAGPLPCAAQPPGRPYRVGILHEGFLPGIPQVEGLKAGLKAAGLEEGRDVSFEVRLTRGKPNSYADGVQAARLVAKILRGAKPQDLPVEGSNNIELVLNLKTARALGVTIPRELLARADQIVE